MPSRNPIRANLLSTIPVRTEYARNSFFPYCVNEWNKLDPAIRDLKKISLFKNALLRFIRPSSADVFNVNDPTGLKLLTRLRLNLSHLNEHKFNHNFNDTLNPLCSCSLEPESTTHYLLHCHFYSTHRKTLLDRLNNINESIPSLSEVNLVNLLLYGNRKTYSSVINTEILNYTIDFMKTSERFGGALFWYH